VRGRDKKMLRESVFVGPLKREGWDLLLGRWRG
jgi:hypothetical protein